MSWFWRGAAGSALAGVLYVVSLLWIGLAMADSARVPTATVRDEGPAVVFSHLVMRIEGDDRISVAGTDFRRRIVEGMRDRGLNAVDAESLGVGRDDAQAADFLLGGTLSEFECRERGLLLDCRVGIEWQLLDVRADVVVYKVTARKAVFGIPEADTPRLARELVLGTLDSLVKRTPFRQQLARKAQFKAQSRQHYARAEFGACATVPKAMPAGVATAKSGTVIVRSGPNLGSGFLISRDGLVLTAAHVIVGKSTVQLQDGSEHDATLVRIRPDDDVALLRIERQSTPCLALGLEPVNEGSDVWVIGAPAGEDFAFSLSRGIVSGVRNLRGRKLLQTDASINPGNSGGPMLDAGGRAIAVASWKLVGTAVEGVAFGVPVSVALDVLGLESGDSTVEVLRTTEAALPVAPEDSAVNDVSDPVPSLDPVRTPSVPTQGEIDEVPEGRSRAKAVFRWGGLALAAGGAVLAAVTYGQYEPGVTSRGDYDQLTELNGLGWAAAGVGVAGFVTSFFIGGEPSGSQASTVAVGGQHPGMNVSVRY